MFWSAISLWFFLHAISADSFNSFHKGTSTEKPDIPYDDSPVLKPRKLQPHISDFTDPATGLNPFLDIEEGPTSAGRNVMKDKGREDPPFFDFELVEGHAPDRRLGFEVPQQPSEPSVQKWRPFEDKVNKDPPTTTIRYVSETPTTTVDSHANTPDEVTFDVLQTEQQKIEKAVTSSSISKDSLIYASATVIIVVALALLCGVCWWRRKLKRTTHSAVAVENGDIKS